MQWNWIIWVSFKEFNKRYRHGQMFSCHVWWCCFNKSANRCHWFGTMHNWKIRITHTFSCKNIAQSNSKILVKTVDSDAVVITISVYHRIFKLHELWVEFSKGKDLNIAIHRIVSNLGAMSASAIPFFHALTGCDTTSSIFGKNKKVFYDA